MVTYRIYVRPWELKGISPGSPQKTMLLGCRGHACSVLCPPAPTPTVRADHASNRAKFPTSFLVTLRSQAVSGSRARNPRRLPAARHWQLPSWICGCEEATGWVLNLQVPQAGRFHPAPCRQSWLREAKISSSRTTSSFPKGTPGCGVGTCSGPRLALEWGQWEG